MWVPELLQEAFDPLKFELSRRIAIDTTLLIID
jgi:hypothetical protein